MATYRPPRPRDPYEGTYDELDSFEPEISRSQPNLFSSSFSLPDGSWADARAGSGRQGRVSRGSLGRVQTPDVEPDTFGGFEYDHETQQQQQQEQPLLADEATPLNSTGYFQTPYHLSSTPAFLLDASLPAVPPRGLSTPIFPDDTPLLSPPSPAWLYVGRCSHVLARDMWEFAVPLILVELFPSNIMAPSVYSLFSMIALLILSPLLAVFFSRATKRATALAVLSTLQVVGTLGASGFIYWLADDKLQQRTIDNVFWSSWKTIGIFAASVVFGSLSPVSARLLDEAVDFEWISLLYNRAERVHVLGRLESCVAFVRVLAPVFTGLLLSKWVGLRLGITIIIAVCTASLIPAVGCLGKVVTHAPGYAYRQQVFWQKRFPNPIAFLVSEWSVYSNQAVFLVMMTNLFLWISIFNPHSSVLIAILKCYDFINRMSLLSNPVLGGFRAVSTFFGFVLGPFIFEKSMQMLGLIPSTQLFVSCAAVVALATALFYQFVYSSFFVLTILFLCSCVLEEFFSCGFSTGEDQILQAGVPRKWRNTLHVAQMGLTDIALFIVYSGATVLSFPAEFPYLIWATFGTVGMASVIFAVWSLNRTNRNIVLLGPISTIAEASGNPDQDSLMLVDEIN